MTKKLSEMTLEELWRLFPIVLTEHRDEWEKWFEEEKRTLTALLPGDAVISHIGSTAIKGIWAKPIVDMLIELPDREKLQRAKETLAANGYLCMSAGETRVSMNRGYTEEGFAERVFHLHLRLRGDRDEIVFRDYLNGHPGTAKEYEQLKLGLWKRFEHDRDGYTQAKTEFVSAVLNAAGQERANGAETGNATGTKGMTDMTERKITIRPEEHKDYKEIVSLILRSFREGTDYSDGTDIVALVEEIRDSKYHIPELSFVAEMDGKIVGHFLFSHFPLSCAKDGGHDEEGGSDIVMLAPVSVHADHLRQGIGSAMIRLGIERVRAMGYKGITVEGNFNFYNKVGFRTSSEFGIYPTGGWPMNEPRCMMCQETYPGSLHGISGYIVYDMYCNA